MSGCSAYNVWGGCIGVWCGYQMYHWWVKGDVGCIDINVLCGLGGVGVNDGYHGYGGFGRIVLYLDGNEDDGWKD
jgi:hypothetical protein